MSGWTQALIVGACVCAALAYGMNREVNLTAAQYEAHAPVSGMAKKVHVIFPTGTPSAEALTKCAAWEGRLRTTDTGYVCNDVRPN